MTFASSIRTVFRHYAVFSGRASRPEFWWWTLFEFVTRFVLGVIYTIVMIVMLVPAITSSASDQTVYIAAILSAIFNPAYWILLAWSLGILLPTLGVTVRRLHDTGRSGWNILIGLIPVAGIILLIIFCAEASEPQSNSWGNAPEVPGGRVT